MPFRFSLLNQSILLILLMTFSIPQLKAQYLDVDTASYIEWSDKLYLSWNDYQFKETTNEDRGGMALTSVKHSVRGGIVGGIPRFEVKVLFVRGDSWTTDSTNIALLAHEKLHFDIAELYGRKIRKQIDELYKRGERDLKIYNKYVKQLLADFNRYSLNYDTKTQNGKDFDEQKKWFDNVYSEMERLKLYYK